LRLQLRCIALLAGLALPAVVFAHGIAGKRFFPATPTIDDPFVADELSLPLVTQRRLPASGDSPETLQTSTSMDYTKRLTQNLGVGFGINHLRLANELGVEKGFDNLSASVKYQFYKSDAREAVASVGLDWDIGGTGQSKVGAESFSTFTPALFVGKGFGDLPDSVKYLRPLALTSALGLAIPSRKSSTTIDEDGNASVEQHPDVLKLGFAIEYSLPYLQSFVKDVGLREPFNRLIPLVEFDLQKPVDRGAMGWSGTVNPGVVWAGRYMQFALEAIVPVNSRTGSGTGVLFQVHFFIDDIFPRSLGKPVF
jgi:hypothetical protein